MPGQQDLPVFGPGHRPPPAGRGPGLVDVALGAGAAVNVGARVGGMGEDLVHRRVGGRDPGRLPVPQRRQLQAVLTQPQPHLPGRPGRGEPVEHGGDRAADRLIGMEQDLPGCLAPSSPAGSGIRSSPRAALFRSPPSIRARSTCSSASYADFSAMPTSRRQHPAGRDDGQERSA